MAAGKKGTPGTDVGFYDAELGWKDPEDHAAKRGFNPSDPLGEVSIFEETGGGVPSFESSAPARVFEYVDRRARAIGTEIPTTRGVPRNTNPDNLLSGDEKAIVLLGRAVGIPYRLIQQRVNDLRANAGKQGPVTSDPTEMCGTLVSLHKDIVAAIQTDMLAAIEEWSPLVSGQHRFVWHARMIEMYRAIIIRLSAEPEDAIRRVDKRGRVIWLDKVDEMRRLDNAMQAHMKYFERTGVSGDLSAMLSNPSSRIEEQRKKKQETEIEEAFTAGEITDIERLKRIRHLRHGATE